ncbi:hydroxymethylglutaryl-CoA synthase [Paramicrobacterium agarici]|uniref:Hydroxymethylglutaryl-CoA synthase n=1 Tax=Paramicrobacterium agarici TaxID=630514 RepID=A0A2A9DYX2_9MICO|nr:hydroxymethylglutaryl-CoA synthase [Microbacterium agarici]PFG31566.1 hydroxymethylglutaryl-CoA synthase [Microbacterium agarici]
MTIGIHDISAATGSLVFALADLAEHEGIDVGKYHRGIGQTEMSLTTEDEDIVTMAARAAKPILERHGVEGIRTVVFATESGIDQSKAASVFLHGVLGLPRSARVVEVKEACYSATAAIQFGLGIVERRPSERVLVIASDVARYELNSSGEATQGSGAVAMLIAKDPAVLEIEPVSGLWTDDVWDFWRPNDRSTALVDGKYSVQVYLESLEGAWQDYRANGGAEFSSFARVCYHQPFTRMAVKAQQRLARIADPDGESGDIDRLADTVEYNARIGNTYTASIYLALLSLLDNGPDLAGERIGFFSYGSGAVGEFFAGVLVPGYKAQMRTDELQGLLEQRRPIAYDEYRHRHIAYDRVGDFETADETQGDVRFAGIAEHRRLYESR